MPHNEISNGSDAPAQHSAQPEASHNLRQDAGFSHVGDSSGNAAWSKMTGSGGGSDASTSHAGMNKGAGGEGGSLNFGDHGDIYNQSSGSAHSGMKHSDAGPSGGAGGRSDVNAANTFDASPTSMGGSLSSDNGSPPGGAGDSRLGSAPPQAHSTDLSSGVGPTSTDGRASSANAAGSGSGEAGSHAPHAAGDGGMGARAGADGGASNADLAGRGSGEAGSYAPHAAGDGAMGARAGADGGASNADLAGRGSGEAGSYAPHAAGDGGMGARAGADSSQTSAAGSDAGAKPDRVPFDSKTATYDGSQFYEVEHQEQYRLSDQDHARLNENNFKNLAGRIEKLGDKMPDVVARGVNHEGVDDMEKLAGNKPGEFSDYSNGKAYFATASAKPENAEDHVAQLAGHFQKAQDYALRHGGNGGIYAFAHSGSYEQEPYNKLPLNAPKPFPEEPSSGEAELPLNKDKFTHITTLTGQDVHPKVPDDAVYGANTVDNNRASTALKGVDKIVSAIENAHPDFARTVEAKNEAQAKAEAQAQAKAQPSESPDGWYSRLSNSVKSWF